MHSFLKHQAPKIAHSILRRPKKSIRAAQQDRPDVAAAREALQKQQPRLDRKRPCLHRRNQRCHDDCPSLWVGAAG
jgi:hypothetical protein